MKKLSFILFVLVLGSPLAAQNINKFSRLYSVISGVPCYAQRVIVQPDGYVLFGETADSSNTYTRVSVTKIDTVGNVIWNKSYGKNGYNYYFGNVPGGADGVMEPSGNYMETGWITNDSNTWSHLALFYFNSNGDTLWTRSYADSTKELGINVKITREKQYIIGGEWANYKGSGFFTTTLKKTDSLGNVIWQKTYHGAPGHYRESLAMDTCKDDGYIICAYDGDTNFAYGCGGVTHIMKIDSSGTPQWTKDINSPVCLYFGTFIKSLQGGGYVLGGDYVDAIKFGGAKKNGLLNLTKLSSAGSIIWSKQYGKGSWNGGSIISSVKELKNGDIIACGSDSSSILGCILKVDSNGNEKWLRYYSILSPPEQHYLMDIQTLPNEGYVATGLTYGSIENIWVVKTDSLGCADSAGCNYMGINEPIVENGEVRVYPNPSNGAFTLQVGSGQLAVNSKIEVYNMLGEEVYTASLNPSKGGTSVTTLNLSGNAAGIYMYRVITAAGRLLGEGKLIIE